MAQEDESTRKPLSAETLADLAELYQIFCKGFDSFLPEFRQNDEMSALLQARMLKVDLLLGIPRRFSDLPKDEQRMLGLIIETLWSSQRLVDALIDIDLIAGYSHKEIAEMWGIPATPTNRKKDDMPRYRRIEKVVDRKREQAEATLKFAALCRPDLVAGFSSKENENERKRKTRPPKKG